MLVSRLTDAPTQDWHQLSSRILMDAGEMGSRQMTITCIEIPPGVEQSLHSHEEAEQAYVVLRGIATLTAAGDSQQLQQGDLALIPPASDHTLANLGTDEVALISIQSPAVSVEETFGRQREAIEYDEEEF